MTLSEFSDLVTPIGVVLAAVASIVAAIGNFVNGRKINDVHVEINSRMTELIKASHSEGMAAERLREEARQALQAEELK